MSYYSLIIERSRYYSAQYCNIIPKYGQYVKCNYSTICLDYWGLKRLFVALALTGSRLEFGQERGVFSLQRVVVRFHAR